MASIRAVEEIWQSGAEEAQDLKGVVVTTYKRHFRVVVDDPRVSRITVLSHVLIPALGATYADALQTDPFARCIKRTANHAGQFYWEVDVEYSTRWEDPEAENPLDRPARFSRSTRDFQRPCELDFTGYDPSAAAPDDSNRKSCRNSSLEPFDPPLVSQCAEVLIRVEKNYDAWNEQWENYLDPKAINAGEFLGKPEGTMLLSSLNVGDELTENEVTHVKAVLEFWYRKQGWLEKPLDQGYSHLSTVDGSIIPILDPGTGSVPSRPRLLNGFGVQLAPGSTPVFLDGTVYAGDPVNGPFQTQPKKDFAIFGL